MKKILGPAPFAGKILIGVLIIIAAAAIAYYAFPERVAGYLIDAARKRAGLTKKAVVIGNLRIVYLEGGQGPTVFLLHGYTANKDSWTQFAGYFTKDYHVVIPDIPGYGESSKFMDISYDPVHQIERLHEFTAALKLKPFHIAGNSMGGLFAGLYAARYPEDVLSLGLFDAAGVASPEKSVVTKMFEKGENPFDIKNSADLSRTISLCFVKPPMMPYPLKKVMLQTAKTNQKIYEKELKEMQPDIFSLQNELPKIDAPALILWGDQDKMLDVSSVPVFEKGLKNHRTVILKECGHIPMFEKPKETAERYIDFIKGVKG